MKKIGLLLGILLLMLMMSCGGGGGHSTKAPSSDNAITAFSIDGYAGTINETEKTIAVYMPPGTDVTALVATFTTTGASVTVDSTVQTSGTTANNFTTPVVYTVTAADDTTQNYTVTVTVSASFAGFPDTDFGTDGIVTTPVGSGNDYALALAVQSDGKIVAAGYSYNSSSTYYDFTLIRYNTDGSLDTDFGTGGIVTTPVGSGDAVAYALGIQSDGRIVVAGSSYNGGNSDFTLVRYNTDGSLDTDFGTNGTVTTDFESSNDYAYALGIQSDGQILVAGYSYSNNTYDFALARYNKTDGSLDTTFNITGKVITDVGSSYDYAYALGVLPDGKIVVVGSFYNGSSSDFALVRYDTNGSPDITFGTGGIVITPVGSGNDIARAVAVQSDGQIVVAGSYYNGSINDVALARYNQSNGSLDTDFGTGGIVTTPVGSIYSGATALGIQSDGKIVAGGIFYDAGNSDFVLIRYNADGSLDNGFYTGGIVTKSIGSGYDVATALSIQSDDKIVVGGYSSSDSSNYDFALLRYWP